MTCRSSSRISRSPGSTGPAGLNATARAPPGPAQAARAPRTAAPARAPLGHGAAGRVAHAPTCATGGHWRSALEARRSRLVRLAQQQPAQQVHRDRRRAVADVARPPGIRVLRVIERAVAISRPRSTPRPTGFSSVPPPGPAMPVMPTPIGAEPPSRARRRAPPRPRSRPRRSARSAPGRRPRARPWPRSSRRRRRRAKYADEPARSVSRADSIPPVHDSATAIV